MAQRCSLLVLAAVFRLMSSASWLAQVSFEATISSRSRMFDAAGKIAFGIEAASSA